MKNKRSAGRPEPRRSSWFNRRFSLWNAVFLAAGALAGAGYYHWHADDHARPAPGSSTMPALGTTNVAANQWGNLDIVPIMLDRPEDYLAGELSTPSSSQILWFLGPDNPAKAREFLLSCGLAEAQARALCETNRWQTTSAGAWVAPPLDLIRDLDPTARGRIYRRLARYPQNENQRYPCLVRNRSFKEWFAESGLGADKLAVIERMTYRNKNALYFADLPYLQRTFSPDDLRRALRALSRVPTFLMNLRITPDTDVDALLRYWGTTTRAEKVKPLLQSLKQVSDGTSINVSWLFPPVPRLLVYSYPNPTNSIGGRYPDCFWTAMNFFNEMADDRLLGSSYALQVLRAQYENVPKPGLFGDVILLYEREGYDIDPVHICVFVAQDVVFTKNGHSLRQPWILMRLSDMVAGYSTERPLQMATYRRKNR